MSAFVPLCSRSGAAAYKETTGLEPGLHLELDAAGRLRGHGLAEEGRAQVAHEARGVRGVEQVEGPEAEGQRRPLTFRLLRPEPDPSRDLQVDAGPAGRAQG